MRSAPAGGKPVLCAAAGSALRRRGGSAAAAAVVSSRWEGQGTYQGKPFTDDQRCGQVWLQTAGEWHVLSEHCIQIAPPAASD